MEIAIPSNIPLATYKFIKSLTYVGIVIAVIVLVGGSILVHDTYWITKNPRFFAIEMILMSVLCSVPVVFIAYTRGAPIATTAFDFLVLVVKFGLLHLGFQLSGVYSELFPASAPAVFA